MSKSEKEILQLEAVKTPERVYVHEKKKDRYSRAGDLSEYLFNGKHPKPAFLEGWYIIERMPSRIERILPPEKINFRYELVDPDMESEKVPKIVDRDEVSDYDDDEYEWLWKDEWKHLASLYELKWDLSKETCEDMDFEFTDVFEMNEVAEHKGFSYPVYRTRYKRDGTTQLTENSAKSSLSDRLFFPSVVLPDRPVKLSKKQTFGIIRYHVSQHIDPKVAKITSDYAFCFTVKKKIPLSEPEKYQVDASRLGSKRPKWMVKTRREREIQIFEMAPEPYQNYTVVEPFEGENWTELKEKIEKYLNDLMVMINEPLHDCPHCGGYGVVLPDGTTAKCYFGETKGKNE